MNSQTLVNRLLARAFLDIRIAAHEGNSKAAFEIADLFHNVPFQVERIREEAGDFQDVLDSLEMRAAQKKMGEWLRNAMHDSVEE
jgi:hypothetical protein